MGIADKDYLTKSTFTYKFMGYIRSESGVISVTRSTFTNNFVLEYGCLSTYNAVVDISDSIFQDNSAIYGGALYLEASSSVLIDNVIFLNNYARYGGAIYIKDKTTGITIKNCSFEDNFALLKGGTIHISSSSTGSGIS